MLIFKFKSPSEDIWRWFENQIILLKVLKTWVLKSLTWQYHVNDLSIKLNRTKILLFKMRPYVSYKILRSIYFVIFDSYLSYCCLVSGQNCSTIQGILILQKKNIRIINFHPWNFHTCPLFKQNSILKSQDKLIIYHRQFLMQGLVFPLINKTMKSQLLHRVTS